MALCHPCGTDTVGGGHRALRDGHLRARHTRTTHRASDCPAAQGVDLRAVGVTEAGESRPLRLYEMPFHLASAKGVRNAQSSNTRATQRGQGKSGGNQQRLWLLSLRSCGAEDRYCREGVREPRRRAGLHQGTYWLLRDEGCADPGTVRRDRREDKNHRPEGGDACSQRKLKATR